MKLSLIFSSCLMVICPFVYSEIADDEKDSNMLYDVDNNIVQINEESPIVIQSVYGEDGKLIQETYSDGSIKYYHLDGRVVVK